jgi:zeaxanthin glucosyltransferase
MATIVILVDSEIGHAHSTFRLSRRLKAGGHRVSYIGPLDIQDMVRSQGFEYISIVNEALLRNIQSNAQTKKSADEIALDSYFGPIVRGELLDKAFAELRPGAALVLGLSPLEGLAIHYRYRLPVIFFDPSLMRYSRDLEVKAVIANLIELKSGLTEFLELLNATGVHFKNFNDVGQLALGLPRLMFIPEAFDWPDRDQDPQVHYIGAGIDVMRNEQPFPWPDIDSGRPLIFCARGSQLQLNMDTNRRLFQVVIDAAAARPEWQFIIAIGKVFKAEDFSRVPQNVILSNWVPQLTVLSRSTVMINHGGFESVKESIHMGVPMVALSIKGFRDHDDCAQRVAYHGLGLRNNDPQISPDELILLIEQIITDPSFKRRVDQMRETLKQQDRLDLAVEVIERAISGS